MTYEKSYHSILTTWICLSKILSLTKKNKELNGMQNQTPLSQKALGGVGRSQTLQIRNPIDAGRILPRVPSRSLRFRWEFCQNQEHDMLGFRENVGVGRMQEGEGERERERMDGPHQWDAAQQESPAWRRGFCGGGAKKRGNLRACEGERAESRFHLFFFFSSVIFFLF